MGTAEYFGGELELFARATNWKAYLRRQIGPFLGARVLEVGAGLGSNTRMLYAGQARWVCLEPDHTMARRLKADPTLPAACEVVEGTLSDVVEEAAFDTVLYVDVLEHVEHDADELNHAMKKLGPGGRLIVMAPAHQSLYSPFDKAIGHFRRYDRHSLLAVAPHEARPVRTRYLDSVGLAASFANRMLLNRALPTRNQIWLWDSLMVPLSRLLDPASAFSFGKSILAVWEKPLAA
jgi:2-polyprenyl-3-methyl-5-hydroxy-6-metoxy-1,4-benzoquinol methylase